MSDLRRNVGFGGIALLPIACCIGLPLLVAAGFGVAAVALVGGIAVGALALGAAIGLLIVRARRRRRLHAPPIAEIARKS